VEQEISLKELWNVIWKGKWIIILSAILGLVLSFAGVTFYNNNTSAVTTVITLQWDGISKGEYPDGEAFYYNEAIETYVLTNAIDATGLTLNTADVRDAMVITPIVPTSAQNLIVAALEDGEQLTYYATNYKITLSNGELGITVDEAINLLNNIITEFRSDFETKYLQSSVVLDFTDMDFQDVEYVDIYNIMATQANVIQTVMDLKATEDPTFTSQTLGIGFNEILVQLSLVQDIQLDEMNFRISSYLLAKDEEYLVTKYNYQIEQKTFEKETLELQETSTQTLIDNYTGSTQTILIPGLDASQVIEIETYYETLVQGLIDIQQQIAVLEKDIEYLELQVSRIEGTDPLYTVTQQEQDDNTVRVEQLITTADDELSSILEDANTILFEYNTYKISSVIKPLMTPAYEPGASTIMVVAVGAVIGASIAGLIVLFKHDWPKLEQTEEKK
jgi:hypothetical protein